MADFASIKRDYSLDFKLLNESTSSSGISFFIKGYDLYIKFQKKYKNIWQKCQGMHSVKNQRNYLSLGSVQSLKASLG